MMTRIVYQLDREGDYCPFRIGGMKNLELCKTRLASIGSSHMTAFKQNLLR